MMMGGNQMDNEDSAKMAYETAGVPTVYCNLANVTISFSDLRLYLAEVGPKTIAVTSDLVGTKAADTKSEAVISPKLSVVFTPEFAKSVGDALLKSVAKYEEIFGPLRASKTPQQVIAAMQQSNKQ
jgi:uncharacterized protein DUF3467